MYNSVFINITMKIVRAFQRLYSESLTHKIISSINNILARAFNSSTFKKVFNNLEEYFNKAYINVIIGKFINLIDKILNGLNYFFRRYFCKSDTIKGLDDFSQSYSNGFKFIYLTLIGLAIVFFIFYIKGNLIINPLILVLILIIGIIGLVINGKEIALVEGSKIINFFVDIFEIDEGGNQWW